MCTYTYQKTPVYIRKIFVYIQKTPTYNKGIITCQGPSSIQRHISQNMHDKLQHVMCTHVCMCRFACFVCCDAVNHTVTGHHIGD